MRFWLQLLVTAVLVAILVLLIDWREAAVILSDADPGGVLVAFVLCVVGISISAIRWNVLLRAHGIVVSNYHATRFYWIGAFAGNYLPSNIGGDVARAIVMKQPDKLAQIGASIVVERITGLFIVLALVIPSLLFRSDYYSVGGLLPLVWFGVACLAAATAGVVLLGGNIESLLRAWGKSDGSLARRGIHKLRKLVRGVNDYGDAKRAVVVTTIWAAVFYANMIAFHYIVLVSVGAHVPWLEVVLIAPLIPLVSFLPISLNSIGVAEGAFVFFYSQAGVAPETALAAAVLTRIVMTLTTLLGGLFWLQDRKRRQRGNYVG